MGSGLPSESPGHHVDGRHRDRAPNGSAQGAVQLLVHPGQQDERRQLHAQRRRDRNFQNGHQPWHRHVPVVSSGIVCQRIRFCCD